MTLTTLYAGKEYTLSALVINGDCLVQEFLSGLDKQSERQIMSLLERTGDNGPLRNEEKFKRLEGKIYELKTRTGVRILSFFGEGHSLILTHGFFKPSKKKLKMEISKAAGWERSYQESIKSKKKDKKR
jgi:phage-related protein